MPRVSKLATLLLLLVPARARAAPSGPADTVEAPRDPADTSQDQPLDVAPTLTGTAAGKPRKGPRFVKGDLISLGTRELVSRFDHFGVQVGPHIIDKDLYLGVTPGFALYGGAWAVALEAPLNLLAVEAGTTHLSSFHIRREDWQTVSDYARVIRFLTFGRKEDHFYAAINTLRPTTLGNGELMHNYQPNIDVNRSMTGAVVEGYNDYAGFQAQINDVTFQNRVVGGLLFVKPLGFLDGAHWAAKSLSLGVEYAADLLAPRCIEASASDHHCILGGPTASQVLGNQAGPDPLTGLSRDDTFIRTDPNTGQPVVETTTVQAIGFSGQMKVMKTDRSDMKLYGTYHRFLGAGDGFALGWLGRFTTGDYLVNAFRAKAELRTFGQGFIPGYFDTIYEVAKYQYPRPVASWQVTPTKYQAIFGDPRDGFVLDDPTRKYGYDVEASWGVFRESRDDKQIALGLGLSQSTAANDTSFYAHLELPVLRWLQLFGSFIRVNAPDLKSVFAGDLDNVVVLSGVRLQVLPFLFLNVSYSRAYEIVRGAGRELHLGNGNVVDAAGHPSPFFPTDKIYENVQTLFADLELGWEFRK